MVPEVKLRPLGSSSDETAKRSAYIGWSPVNLSVVGDNASGKPNIVRLKSKSLTKNNTQLVFRRDLSAPPVDEIVLDLGDGGQASCFVAGKFQEGKLHNGASPDGKDVAIEAVWIDKPKAVAGSLDFMIRVRRNAQNMNDRARDDFTCALAELNCLGKGIYVTDFVALHVAGAVASQHRDSHFLPWHRMYLLDLERQLQLINPLVSLPYWRFDQPAPRVFDENFIGATEKVPFTDDIKGGTSDGVLAKFSAENKLSEWKIGDRNGIERVAVFDTKTEAAPGRPSFRLRSEADTLDLGGSDRELGARGRTGFAQMEGTPHGAAHVSFDGVINNVPSAPQDPLFFLLHCNVDRLWAMWQFLYLRDLPVEPATYPYQNRLEIGLLQPPSVEMNIAFDQAGGASVTPTSSFSGLFPDEYKLAQSYLWPWDDSWSKPHNLRPPGTRSRSFTMSSTGKSIEAGMPRILDALDAYGYHATSNYLGFSYDDVPFDHERALT